MSQIILGDCLGVLRGMPDNSIDAVVTDPPYGLAFMGKKWDYDVPSAEIWAECLRVLKPGGHLLCFAGTRTQHRMCVRIEDAGFEIRDMIAWVYGSGFPKSLDVSKAIDKIEGHWRGRAGEIVSDNGAMSGGNYLRTPKGDPITDAARQWQGWGTAIKPALEPITVARKPIIGTVAANVLAHGTGAINVDACRIMQEGQERDADAYRRLSSLGSASYIRGLSLSQLRGSLLHIASALRSCSTGGTARLRSDNDLDDTLLDYALCERLVARLFPNGAWCGGSSWSVPDFLCGCRSCRHSCDEHTRLLREVAQGGAPSLADALERICSGRFGLGHNRECRCNGLLSSSDDSQLAWSFSFLVNEYCTLYSVPPRNARWPANLIHDGSEEVTSLLDEAARFFKECKPDNDIYLLRESRYNGFSESTGERQWQDQSRRQSSAGIAEKSLSLQSALESIVQKVAATLPSLAGIVSSDLKEHSILVTLSELKTIEEVCITTMTTIACGFSLESQLKKHTQCGSLVSVAAAKNQTGITTITASLLRLNGYAENATLSIMQTNLEPGERVCRLKYCAKASKKDRGEGNNHPTVKPTDLMRYLCRLVTPPGGIVLDPFMGSGSTGKAATMEGFRFIGIEREPEYVDIAKARIAAQEAA